MSDCPLGWHVNLNILKSGAHYLGSSLKYIKRLRMCGNFYNLRTQRQNEYACSATRAIKAFRATIFFSKNELTRLFPPKQQTFFSGGWGGGWGGVYLVRKRWQEEPKWQQVLGTMLKAAQLQSLNSHLSPKIVFLWVRYMTNVVRETFLKTATLSVLIWPFSREMKTSNWNFKMPPFCLNSVTMEILLVLFLITRKFSLVESMGTHFAAVSRLEAHFHAFRL